jgi:integrase
VCVCVISDDGTPTLAFRLTTRTDRDYAPEKYVFGALGERLGSIKKTWETAVLKAHGIKPVWMDGKLSAECRTALGRVDLHFHALRREAGSRWHEGGFQLHEVRDVLGHANVSQTDTYLSAKIAGLRESMRRFDATRGKAVAKSESIERRPLSHEEAKESRKDQLH